jgi:pimeloyl-ACP methyl ester carboxylesterase
MPTVNLNGKQMYYDEKGQGFPLLFGHSFLWDASMWEPTVEELSANYRCLVPELWGHGRSDPPDSRDYSIEKLAQDMASFLQALEIQSCVIIGLSVGGMWGAHLAVNNPDLVTSLVLMDTYVGAEEQESLSRYLQMMAVSEQAGLIPPPLIEQIVPLFFSPETMETKPELVERLKQRLSSIHSEQLSGILAIGRGIFGRNSLLERLNAITCPTLVLVGSDDTSMPPHYSSEMVAHLKNAQLEIIPNAGHISNLEQPEIVNAILKQFLERTINS